MATVAWGNDPWNSATTSWGGADPISVSVSGASALFSIGTPTIHENEVLNLGSVQAQAFPGLVVASIDTTTQLSGVSATGATGAETVRAGAGASPAGVSATSSVGSSVVALPMTVNLGGWGRPSWGTGEWGISSSVFAQAVLGEEEQSSAAANVPVTGLQASALLGEEVSTADANVSPARVTGSGQIGSPGVQGALLVAPVGVVGQGEIGVAGFVLDNVLSVTGTAATTFLSSVVVDARTDIAVSGFALTAAVGETSEIGFATINPVSATGTMQIGALIFDSSYSVTGVSAIALVHPSPVEVVSWVPIEEPGGSFITIDTSQIPGWAEENPSTGDSWVEIEPVQAPEWE